MPLTNKEFDIASYIGNIWWAKGSIVKAAEFL